MIAISRQTADLSAYPDLIVIYLGMRAHSFRGLLSLVKIGPQIQRAVDAQPDGLLRHEQVFFSLIPPHVGMRQYWRDFESLEKWTRDMPTWPGGRISSRARKASASGTRLAA